MGFCWPTYILESVCQNRIGILVWNLWIHLWRIHIFTILGLLVCVAGSSARERAWMRTQVCQPSTPALLAVADLCGPHYTCTYGRTPELTLLSGTVTSWSAGWLPPFTCNVLCICLRGLLSFCGQMQLALCLLWMWPWPSSVGNSFQSSWEEAFWFIFKLITLGIKVKI